MDVQPIIQIVTNLGFPIACCVALGWFIYHIYQRSEKREDELRDEIKENREINGKFADIIAKYDSKLEEIKTDVKEIKEDIIIIKAHQ